MSENRTSKYFKYAVGEILLVVIGILIALQINNWNERRKEGLQEREILESLRFDLQSDQRGITEQLKQKRRQIANFSNCLKILTNQKKGTKKEFMKSFSEILTVGGFFRNQTTFNNLQTTGEIRLIQNSALADSIVAYYSTSTGWQTAFRDYARNTIGPYVMQFDHLPQNMVPSFSDEFKRIANRRDDSVLPERSLEDYKKNYFIINALRQRLYNLEGLIMAYNRMLKRGKRLDAVIEQYLEKS